MWCFRTSPPATTQEVLVNGRNKKTSLLQPPSKDAPSRLMRRLFNPLTIILGQPSQSEHTFEARCPSSVFYIYSPIVRLTTNSEPSRPAVVPYKQCQRPPLFSRRLFSEGRYPAAVGVPDRDGIGAALHQLHGQLQGRAGLCLVLIPPHSTPRGGTGEHFFFSLVVFFLPWLCELVAVGTGGC